MNIKPQQLAHSVSPLPAVTVLSSADHFLLQEATDTVRDAARSQGFLERQKLQIDKPTDWQALIQQAQSLSLFDDKKLIECHLPTAKPGDNGSKAILEYLELAPEENRLLLVMGKLEAQSLRSKWFKALEKSALVCRLWPVGAKEMPGWISQRLRQNGLSAEPEAIGLLVERVEGNLLAAAQEIEKLTLIAQQQTITKDLLAKSIGNSARYNPFELVEASLNGQVNSALRMLAGLQAEGVDARSVLWAVSNEVRNISAAFGSEGSRSAASVHFQKQKMARNRAAAIQQFLQRASIKRLDYLTLLCAETDRRIKGASKADPWLALKEAVLILSGRKVTLIDLR